jgi:glycosyltransferase involved in cell wall biosynthesis
MHIAQLSQDTSVFEDGGHQDSRKRQWLYGRLLEEVRPGAAITTIVFGETRGLGEVASGNVRFIPIAAYRLRHFLRVLAALAALHREKPLDLLTVQNIHGLYWAALVFGKWKQIPVIGQIHGDIATPQARRSAYRDVYGRWYECLAFAILKKYDVLRVVNSACRSYIEGLGYSRRIEVLPVASGIMDREGDGSWETGDEDRRPETVLFVGRLVKVKNLYRWIDTAALVARERPQAAFVIVGEGPLAGDLARYAGERSMSAHIQFAGPRMPEELPSIYRRAKVLLLTSEHEGHPRVIVEAMRHGAVPVSVQSNGPRDIISHGDDGFLAPPDAGRLAGYVVDLLRDEDLYRRMSQAAMETARRDHDPVPLARRWVSLMVQTAEGGEARSVRGGSQGASS